MRRLIVGTIPFHVPRQSDGGFLTAKSLTEQSGTCPVNWRHWREDDFTFRAAASWQVDKNGILVLHALDDDDPVEAKFLQMVREGRLLWSYGLTSGPQETRNRIARHERFTAPRVKYEVKALADESIRHMAYVTESNFKMDPLWILGDGLF